MPCSWLWYDSHHPHIFCSLQTWLLQFDVGLSSSSADQLHLTHPECSCSCWCRSSKVLQSWPYSHIAALAQGYKVISTTYKLLQSSSPHYLHNLMTVRPFQSTRSSTLVILLQPSVDSSLNITHRSVRYAGPHCGTAFLLLFVFLISSIHHHHPALLQARWPYWHSSNTLCIDVSFRTRQTLSTYQL